MASLTVSSFGPYYQISHATFAANDGDSITIINGPGGGATYEAAIVLDENLTITAATDVGLIQLSMATGIVRLNARGDSSFFITGNASGNIISGGDKDDLFLGEGGNDTLIGGGGDDTAAYLFAPAGVNINIANGGGSNGYGGTDTFTSIESLIGSQHSDTLIGDSADNYFFGLQGNDTITGAGGIDTVSYEDIGLGGSAVVVNLATGTASDGFGGTDTLSGIERVVGSDFGDSLIGDSNDNSFLPGVGNDTVNGGGGTDFVSYETSQSGVTVNLPGQTASDGLGGTDTLISIEGVLGSIFGDSITGGSEANVFSGSAGSDTLNGGGGFDITRYSNSTSGVTVNLATGTASDGLGGTDTLISIEGIEGSAFADTLKGTSSANLFWGMNGDDTIIGGEGDDTASYALAASNYTVTYIPGDGTYTVAANTGDEGTDTLTSIEFLQFGFGTVPVDINSVVVNPPNPNGTYVGDANDNTFDPGDGDDTIDGQGGLDTVTYASSTGAINVNLATGVVDDGMGGTDTLTSIERVFGSDFGDTLTGSDGNDSFLPGLGDDTITGGLGIDTLQFFAATVVDLRNGTATGGEGTDTFTGIEIFFGSAQDDTFHDADGAFLYDGNGGTDLVSYTLSTGPIVANLVTGLVSDGSGAVDTLVAIERIAGSANSSDLFIAATTTTEIDGDAGLDTVSFSEFGSGVTVARNGNDLQATAAGGVRVDLKSIEIFEGSQHNDTLVGLGNSLDVLIGLGGNDRLENLQVGAIGVLASYRIDPSAVTVNLATGSATDGFGGADTLVNIDNVEGSAHNDTLIGNASANLFVGRDGNDTIDGGGGVDIAVYSLAADQYTVAHNTITGTYTVTALSGTDGIDTLTGIERIAFENGNTEVAIGDVAVAIPTVTLTGDGTDNLFTPVAGDNNIIDGLGGFDTVMYATAPSGVTVNLETGIVADGHGGSDSLTSIERIIGSAFGDTLTGSTADETFEMTRGGNVINGAGGTDTLSYANDAVGISLNVGLGIVSPSPGSGHTDTFSNIETFAGTTFDDEFLDAEGAHNYDGAGGSWDTLRMQHSVAVTVDVANGRVVEATGGVNTFANIDFLVGSTANDRFDWASGGPALDGGDGIDTISFASSAGGVSFVFAQFVHPSISGLSTGVVATGFEIAEGSAHNDVFSGSLGRQVEMLGLAGDDTLLGDTFGISGNDWASYRLDPTRVSVNLDLGTASDGFGGTDTLQHIEGVEGSNSGDLLVGDGDGTLFRGLGGDDVIHGGGHASDKAVYKLAQNQYSIHYEAPINAFIVTALSGNEGTDVLRGITTLSFNNGANDVAIETAAGGGALALTIITGSANDDYFALTDPITAVYGMDGFDTVSYRSSAGPVTVDLGADTATDGGGGSDLLWSIEGVVGTAFGDTLSGGADDESFRGDGGNDAISGGGGTDRAIYALAQDQYSVAFYAATGTYTVTALGGGDEGVDTLTGIEILSFNGGATDVAIGDVALVPIFLTGDNTDNSFTPGAGIHIIDGLGGTDTVSYLGAPAGVSVDMITGVVQDGHGGIDTLSNIENITGSSHDDFFKDIVGANAYDGGDGWDQLSYEGHSAGVAIHVRPAGSASTAVASTDGSIDTFTNIGRFKGTAHEDMVSVTYPGLSADEVRGAFHIYITFFDGDAGFDTFEFSVGGTTPGSVEIDLLNGFVNVDGSLNYTLGSFEAAVGSEVGDTLIGSSMDNRLTGRGGDDEIDGGGGNDTAVYALAADQYDVAFDAGTGAYTVTALSGDEGTDTLTNIESISFSGGATDVAIADAITPERLTGDDADNTFTPGAGNQAIDGRGGIDTVSYLGAPASVIVNLATGVASDGQGGIDTLTSIERIIGSAFADSLTGGDAGETFLVTQGNNTIHGNGGMDTLSYQSNGYGISVSVGDGTVAKAGAAPSNEDTFSGIESFIGSNFEDRFYDGLGAQSYNGVSDTSNLLYFTDLPGPITLNPITSTVTESGGHINTYQNIQVIRASTTETDTLTFASNTDGIGYFGGSMTLTTPPAPAIGLSVSGFDIIIGTNFDDYFVPDFGRANTFIGLGGDDRFIGPVDIGIGPPLPDLEHWVSYRMDPAGVFVDLSSVTGLDGFGGTDQITNFERVEGSTFDDALFGDQDDNTFRGLAGNDVIDGAGGTDTAIYALAADQYEIFFNAVPGVYHVVALSGDEGIDTLKNIETLSFNGGTSDIAIASAAAASSTTFNTLVNGDGDDNQFTPGPGKQLVNGLDGTDTVSYAASPGGVTVSLLSGVVSDGYGGIDVLSSIENAVGSGFADTIANGAGNNAIDGAGGSDKVVYALAQDQYTVTYDSGSNSYTVTALKGDEGTDTLTNVEFLSFSGGTVDVAIADAVAPADTTSDFDGDGDDDIVFTLTASGNSVTNYADGTGGDWVGYPSRTVIGTGDFNGDGDADLLFRFADGNHSGLDSGGGSVWMGRSDRTAIAIGDFSGDGDDDVVFQYANGNKHIGDSDNGSLWLGYADRSVAGVGDFDGDGDDDLLFELNSGGYVTNNAEAGGGGIWIGGFNRSVAGIGDFDGDGDDDILWALNSGGHVINTGESTATQWFGFTDRTVAAVGDFDGNGTDDIMFKLADGNHTIVSPSGGGRWVARTNAVVRDVGDYDGDGDDDVIFEMPGGGFVVDHVDVGNAGFGMYFLDRSLVSGDPLGIGLTTDADLV